MRSRNEIKKFKWKFNNDQKLDIDLLELQLHSLYKEDNLNFNSNLYLQDLRNSDGHISVFDSRALTLAFKAFYRSFNTVLNKHGIEIEDMESWFNVLEYGEFNFKPLDIRFNEPKTYLKEAITGKEVYTKFDNGNDIEKIPLKERAIRLAVAPLSIIEIDRHKRFTKGAAIKKTHNNLVEWERSVVESAVRQLKQWELLSKWGRTK